MNNKSVKLEEVSDIMLEVLEAGGEVSFVTAGISMMPLLRNRRDKVVLRKPSEPLRKKDVIFYRRENGQFVLHRIVGIKDGKYILRGDNQWEKEYGITDKNIIARAQAFLRAGSRVVPIDCVRYRLYCFFLPLIRFCRKPVYSTLRLTDFVIKKVKRKDK